jgi:hypothetical protein
VVRENLTNCLFLKQIKKFKAPSFYPGRGDTTHPLASLARFNADDEVLYNPNVDDRDNDFEEDGNEDEEIVELALKNPAQFATVMATEVSLRLSSTFLF